MAIVEFKGGPISHRYLMNRRKDDLARMVLQSWDTGYLIAAEIRAIGDRLRSDGYAGTSDRLEIMANRLAGPRPEAERLTLTREPSAATVYTTREVADAWVAYVAHAFPLYDVVREGVTPTFHVEIVDRDSGVRWRIFDGALRREEPPC